MTQTFSFSGNWGPGPNTVEIDFTNPIGGRHLYVDQVSYDGKSYVPSPQEMTNKTPFNVLVGQ